MEAIEATQFNDLNETMDKGILKNGTNSIPIPDSGKSIQRSQQRRKKRAQKRVRYGKCVCDRFRNSISNVCVISNLQKCSFIYNQILYSQASMISMN